MMAHSTQSGRQIAGRVLLLLLSLVLTPGCLVLDLHPAYDDDSIGWEAGLIGTWESPDDRASFQVERGEWKSYRIHYVYPAESGDLTGYVTAIGDDRYLDVMPVRGADRGSFLIPVHAVLRMRFEDDRLELTPLSYDWLFDQMRSGRKIPGLEVTLDQKENALITSPTAALRAWLRAQPATGPMFGAPTTFTRKPADADRGAAGDARR
jgi:hypothetical protein